MTFAVKDAALVVTKTLPGAASTTVYSSAIDLGLGSAGDHLANMEIKLDAPAVNATMAPDTRTFTYSIVEAATSDLSSGTVVVHASCIVQTGASSAGAAAASFTFRPRVDSLRYVGVRIVSGASTADASTVSATLTPLF